MAVLSRGRAIAVSAENAENDADSTTPAREYRGDAANSPIDSYLSVELGNFIDLTPETITDNDIIGGAQEPYDQTVLGRTYGGPLTQPRVKVHTLAFFAAYALGKTDSTLLDETSFPETAATSGELVVVDDGDEVDDISKHRITPLIGLDLPSFVIHEDVSSDIHALYRGCGITDLSLTLSRGVNRMVSATGTVLAGEAETPSDNSEYLLTPGDSTSGQPHGIERLGNPCNGAFANVWFGEGNLGAGDIPNNALFGTNYDECDLTSTAAAMLISDVGRGVAEDNAGKFKGINTTFRSMTWNFSNGVDTGELYILGSGLGLGLFQRGEITQTVDIELDYENERETLRLLENTELALQMKLRTRYPLALFDDDPSAASTTPLIAIYEGFSLTFPRLKLSTASRGTTAGKNTLTATMQVFQDTANDDPSVILDVWNRFPGYALPAA